MGWWLSPKNIYGLIMGTSTDWMKRSNRIHWPTAIYKADEKLQIFLGGTGNCGILLNGDRTLLINCNSGPSGEELFRQHIGNKKVTLIGTSVFPDYIGSLDEGRCEKIYLPRWSSSWDSPPQTTVVSEKVLIPWGDERVHILPVGGGFSRGDLVVYLENRQMMFLGGLFYNAIHPIVGKERGVNVQKWIKILDELTTQFSVKTFVPHEGDLSGPQGLQGFREYLQALADPELEFSLCRKNYDWKEIPGYTSLEENFEHFREQSL